MLGSSAASGSLLAVKCLLEFLTILWHAKAEGWIRGTTTSSFLASIVAFVKKHRPGSYKLFILRDTLLVAFSTFCCVQPLDDDDLMRESFIRHLVVRSGRSNFIAASGVAHRILVANPCTLLHHDYVDVCDYLRDVLLLILGHRFGEEDEALALLVCPMVCLALTKVIEADWSAFQYLLSSPWTINLSVELRSLIEARQQSRYSVALRRRLDPMADVLLEKIARRIQRNEDTTDLPHVNSKLVFCSVHACSRLVIVSQTID